MRIFVILVLSCVSVVAMNSSVGDVATSPEQLGQNLAAGLCSGYQAAITDSGTMQIRRNRKTTILPILHSIIPQSNQWIEVYTIGSDRLVVEHRAGSASQYQFNGHDTTDLAAPLANSDFSLGDLGLEFFHWPSQSVIKTESVRTQKCSVLQSTNPSTNGYSKVLTWINSDNAIIQVKAFDAKNKLLKSFYPEKVQKIDGEWHLMRMEIVNEQPDSTTRITFQK